MTALIISNTATLDIGILACKGEGVDVQVEDKHGSGDECDRDT